MRLSGADILVTGVSGFVGAALGRQLRDEGARVTGVSRSPPRDGACDVHLAHDLVAPLSPKVGAFDAIVHCAALASPWAKPAAYARNNVEATRQLLAFARQVPPQRFLFISSSAVHYRYADQTNVREDTPLPRRSINHYAASKRKGESLVRESGLPWTIARPRAVYGPGDTVVFPRILRAARAQLLPELVRMDGVSPKADLLYVENLAYYLARLLSGDLDGVYLLTDGAAVDIAEMLGETLAALGLPAPKRRVPLGAALAAARALEFASIAFHDWREPAATRFGISSLAYTRTFDIARARAALGAPPFTRDEGMAAFIAWQRPRL